MLTFQRGKMAFQAFRKNDESLMKDIFLIIVPGSLSTLSRAGLWIGHELLPCLGNLKVAAANAGSILRVGL